LGRTRESYWVRSFWAVSSWEARLGREDLHAACEILDQSNVSVSLIIQETIEENERP
jgi:hypothetical protein